jgi:hypothetical protein
LVRPSSVLIRAAVGGALLVGLGVATVAIASERVAPLSEAPTATELVAEAPLGEAFRDTFVGASGVYDPANGLVAPGDVAFDIEVKAAHNGDEIFFYYEIPTPRPSFYHDVAVYRDGAWIQAGILPIGTEPHGLQDDGIMMLIDDGSVPGFSNQGGFLTCHDDLLYDRAPGEAFQAHPVLGGTYGYFRQSKYIPQSRDGGTEWWQASWDAMSLDNLDAYQQRREAGVFLDLWQWQAHRSAPVGYADNQYIFDTRHSDPGAGTFISNWDAAAGQPRFMFDPYLTGYLAMEWDLVQQQGYTWAGQGFYLAEGDNALPFDPDHEWQDGDTIPGQLLRIPEGNRAAIRAATDLAPDGDAWRWQVELRRAMDTGQPTTDKAFVSGRTYNAAIAVHRLATRSRWHFVTLPFTVGVDMPADVTAARFEGDRPDWDAIEGTTLVALYPGQTNWQWLTSSEHPGASRIRNDSMSVVGCHNDPVGLAAANRSLEPRLAGISTPEPDTGLLRRWFDPGNAAFVFLMIAAISVLGAVVIGRLRSAPNPDEDQP